jgi:O-6-methylguanine DNA methyltransferase
VIGYVYCYTLQDSLDYFLIPCILRTMNDEKRKLFFTVFRWPLSDLLLVATERGLCTIRFIKELKAQHLIDALETQYHAVLVHDESFFTSLIDDLNQYLSGEIVRFRQPVDLIEGSPFQQKVWVLVKEIPYGHTATYLQIAEKLGDPGAIRAVGGANGTNPIPIVIPCHRVVRSNGHLGGYGGGLEIKDYLLRLEGAIL